MEKWMLTILKHSIVAGILFYLYEMNVAETLQFTIIFMIIAAAVQWDYEPDIMKRTNNEKDVQR